MSAFIQNTYLIIYDEIGNYVIHNLKDLYFNISLKDGNLVYLIISKNEEVIFQLEIENSNRNYFTDIIKKAIIAGSKTNSKYIGHVEEEPEGNNILFSTDNDIYIRINNEFSKINSASESILIGGNNVQGPISLGTNTDKSLFIKTNDTERIKITPEGKVIINPGVWNTPVNKTGELHITQKVSGSLYSGLVFQNEGAICGLSVSPDNALVLSTTDESGDDAFVGSFNLSTGVYSALSDKNFKENIKPISESNIIYSLNPVKFNFKNSDKTTYGFIAREVEEVLPNLVSNIENRKLLDQTQLISLLVKEVQDLKKEIDKLKK